MEEDLEKMMEMDRQEIENMYDLDDDQSCIYFNKV